MGRPITNPNREEARECERQWRAANPERARERLRRFRANHPEKSGKWRKEHLAEVHEAERKYREANGEQCAERVRRCQLERYGLTPEDYDRLLRDQNGVCVICGRPPQRKRLHVDHDHETGVVRGLLCYRCNTGIGLFGDSVDRLLGAAHYLQQHSGQ